MISDLKSEVILLTGGTGYIGCHIAIKLVEAGYKIMILDDLSNSSIDVLTNLEDYLKIKIPFFNVDVRDKLKLEAVFKENFIDGIIHLAGIKSVPESVENPMKYYDVNVIGSMNVIDLAQTYGVKKFIFSSSASVYSDSQKLFKEDEASLYPVSPYASTKFAVETILRHVCNSQQGKNLKGISLRYFNPVGAHSSGHFGDASELGNFSNLFKIVESIAVGLKDSLSIYGTDYNTIDGTPVRDYIHVEDIAEGHVMTLSHFDKHKEMKYDVFNMGTESGLSVKQILDAYISVNKINIPYIFTSRRPGDVECLTADCSKIRNEMGWSAKKNLDEMCKDSYNWAKSMNSKKDI